ncbi:sporulation protein YqfD [Candidatus Epulonipiscium fishelsonii]|uniref:Sporulation protein YqfD n=1 Tax=Candidatus Epulonipiscium fishelsonii TaxID=77094 RepID=A0ACC8XH64_9FIRM|nr:sporulation protein YqfD [Epulopiscium sp. SCG-D08WGA-EpuloA1]OON91264.1 MAG: sporulation protein YqfD [Epulopiscium sp. AS2M-Bin002]
MFVSLWNYFNGYVVVEVSGVKIERFINGALRDGNTFWDVSHTENSVILKTTLDGFKNLKSVAYRSKCRIRILDKKGLPFLGFRYRKRKLLMFGSLIFVGCLYALTSFVWLVEIEGANNLEETNIIETLKEGGYTTGKLKWNLNLRQAEQYLVDAYPEILWSAISFEGTKLNVQITEAVPKPIIHDETIPTDIIAKRDGIITYIATNTGIPKVKKGDTVKKGDVLVSGIVPIDSDVMQGVRYVPSSAVISAKTGYTLEAKLPIEQIKKNYISEETKSNFGIQIFDLQIPLIKNKIETEDYDTLVTIHQLKLTSHFPLPFYWIRSDKVPYKSETRMVEEQDLKDILEGKLHDELRRKITETGEVISTNLTFTKADGYIVGRLQAVVHEDIGAEVEVTMTEN